MRILMVAHSFPRAAGDVAGAFLWRLGEGLVGRGHEVTVIAPADRGDVGEPMLGRVRVRRVRYASPAAEVLAYQGTMHALAAKSPLHALNFVRMLRALAQAVEAETRSTGAHVIHAHWWVPGGLAVRYAKRQGRPFIVTLHGSDVRLAGRIPGARAAMASVLRQATTVTAVSSYLAAEAAAAMGVARTTILLTPMPLALGIGADPDQARAGAIFVGRLTRQKGVHDLLEALAMLKRDGRLMDLTVVGDGPERGNLKAQARALGLNVTFTGFVAPDLVGDHLRDKRVFVLPALDEGLGLVVAEALTQGVPVVATRSGGIPDLFVDPEAGMLVPPSLPGALADAIRVVASDDRYKVGAVRAGRILADRLSAETVAEQFEGIYQRTRGSRASLAQIRDA
jgi:glycosyltransferase involved in cell wall biosynthesis